MVDCYRGGITDRCSCLGMYKAWQQKVKYVKIYDKAKL